MTRARIDDVRVPDAADLDELRGWPRRRHRGVVQPRRAGHEGRRQCGRARQLDGPAVPPGRRGAGDEVTAGFDHRAREPVAAKRIEGRTQDVSFGDRAEIERHTGVEAYSLALANHVDAGPSGA